MPGGGVAIAQGAAMERARFFPAFQGEVLGDESIRDEATSAVGKCARPDEPLCAVEALKGFDHLRSQFRLARGK
jgi:hypothetical protein